MSKHNESKHRGKGAKARSSAATKKPSTSPTIAASTPVGRLTPPTSTRPFGVVASVDNTKRGLVAIYAHAPSRPVNVEPGAEYVLTEHPLRLIDAACFEVTNEAARRLAEGEGDMESDVAAVLDAVRVAWRCGDQDDRDALHKLALACKGVIDRYETRLAAAGTKMLAAGAVLTRERAEFLSKPRTEIEIDRYLAQDEITSAAISDEFSRVRDVRPQHASTSSQATQVRALVAYCTQVATETECGRKLLGADARPRRAGGTVNGTLQHEGWARMLIGHVRTTFAMLVPSHTSPAIGATEHEQQISDLAKRLEDLAANDKFTGCAVARATLGALGVERSKLTRMFRHVGE